jgi:hypothetical protein
VTGERGGADGGDVADRETAGGDEAVLALSVRRRGGKQQVAAGDAETRSSRFE